MFYEKKKGWTNIIESPHSLIDGVTIEQGLTPLFGEWGWAFKIQVITNILMIMKTRYILGLEIGLNFSLWEPLFAHVLFYMRKL